jgi:anti-sigma-K factor RskA
MDLQSFIQSGLLEAYVAGQCTAAESQEVERMAAQHPEVRAELARIEQALEKFAVANAIAPPPGLKDRILEHIDKLPASGQTPGGKPGSAGNTMLRSYQWLAIVLAAGAAFLFWQKMFLSAEHDALKKKAAELQAQVDDCAKRRELTEPMANLLRDTDTKPVALSDDGKTYNITIFNNKLRKECALDISGLPAPNPGKYLQAWAIVPGKDPISLGMVRLDATAGWQPLPYIEGATNYAISEEDNPQGNPSPTLVIAIGTIDLG